MNNARRDIDCVRMPVGPEAGVTLLELLVAVSLVRCWPLECRSRFAFRWADLRRRSSESWTTGECSEWSEF